MRSSRPDSWDEFIGNQQAVAALRIATLAAADQKTPLPHYFIIGPQGVGKTTLARLPTKDLGCKMVTCVGNAISNMSDLADYVLQLGFQGHLFVDELHMIPTNIQNAMLPLIEENRLSVGTREYIVPPFTLVGATTEYDKVIGPLKNRAGYVIRLAPYGDDEIRAMATKIIDYAEINEDALNLLVSICRGTARTCDIICGIKLRNYVLMLKNINLETPVISYQIVSEMMALNGIYPQGLSSTDIDYLKVLNDSPTPLSRLAIQDKLACSDFRDSESYLKRLGYITTTSKGQSITPQGRLYMLRIA